MTPREARELVASIASNALGAGWAGWASPPEQTHAPAIVVGPRDPYREPGTFCAEVVNLRLTVLAPRVQGQAGLDVIDAALDTLRAAFAGEQAINWERVGTIAPGLDVGGVDLITAGVDVTVYLY
jgi:hypothetical protein